MNVEKLTVKEILNGLDKKEFTSVELVNAYFDRIEKYENEIGAFVTLTKEEALKDAKASDDRRANGEKLGALEGVPIAIKDNMCTKGVKTTCSSRMLEDFIPPYDATVIEKLKAAGAVIIGKTNMDEFAMGGSTETSYFKKTKNPWNTECVPGGSSGGSAAAVAAGFAPIALGSDTGGSIRQPASYCGIVGFKPTYGTVSRYGLVAFASSLDQIGPFAKTAEDAALVMNVIAGSDEHDSTSARRDYDDFTSLIDEDVKGLRIGIPKEFFEGLNDEVKSNVEKTIEMLKSKGAIVDEVSLKASTDAIAVYYIIACAEASSNLARFDGIRYGHKAEKYSSLIDMYKVSRAEGFGEEVKRRIMLGTYVLSSGYYDAYYKKAQQYRTVIIDEYNKIFENHDIVLMPTAPTPAFKFGACSDSPLTMYLNDVCTVPVNVAGLPGMSVPCGFTENKMPVGVHLIANKFEDKVLFKVANTIEKELKLETTASLEVR